MPMSSKGCASSTNKCLLEYDRLSVNLVILLDTYGDMGAKGNVLMHTTHLECQHMPTGWHSFANMGSIAFLTFF